MSLGDRIPSETRSLNRSNAIAIFWICLCTFLSLLVVFLLLQRLGLPAEIVVGAIITLSVAVLGGLAWISRTMTSSVFFFANRALGPFTSGLGSSSDFLSGALLILFFSTHLTGKMVIATGLVLGVLFHAALFSAPFQRSGAAGIPGYFSWRFGRQFTGYLSLLAVFGMLFMFAMAEFQIARNLLQVQTGLSLEQTGLAIILLAVLPSLFGGWTGLLLVNAVLAIWMLACTLIPAIATGFFAPMLKRALQLDFVRSPMEELELAPSTVLFGLSGEPSNATIALSVLVIAAGISTLPHAMSRLSTNSRAVEAIESVGWLALMVFLMLSALPLSVGLIIASPTSPQLAVILKSQPVLQILPYFVILFAALNGLAATLFTAASSVVRATSRLRNIDPGEQSVFSTRLGILVLAAILLALPDDMTPSPEHLLVGALMLGAGGLFVPMVASTWAGAISVWAADAAILLGAATTAVLLSPLVEFVDLPVVWAGLLGGLVASIILTIDRLIAILRGRTGELNTSAQILRRH